MRLWEKPWVRWLCGYPVALFCGAALVYDWRVIYALGEGMPGSAAVLTAAVCGMASLLYLAAFLSAHFLRENPALKTAAFIVLAGLLFVFANPPLQAPDEGEHFLRAYSIGGGNFLFDQQEDYPDDVDLLAPLPIRRRGGLRADTGGMRRAWPRERRLPTPERWCSS